MSILKIASLIFCASIAILCFSHLAREAIATSRFKRELSEMLHGVKGAELYYNGMFRGNIMRIDFIDKNCSYVDFVTKYRYGENHLYMMLDEARYLCRKGVFDNSLYKYEIKRPILNYTIDLFKYDH